MIYKVTQAKIFIRDDLRPLKLSGEYMCPERKEIEILRRYLRKKHKAVRVYLTYDVI